MLLFVVVLVVTNIKSDGKKAKPREPEHKNHKKSCDPLPHVQKKMKFRLRNKKATKKTFNTNINTVKDNFTWSSTIK